MATRKKQLQMWPAPAWSFRRLKDSVPMGLHTYTRDGYHFGSIYVHRNNGYSVEGIGVSCQVRDLSKAKHLVEHAYMCFWGFVTRQV